MIPTLLLAFAQAPAATPTPAPTMPPAAFMTAAQAYGQCIGHGAEAVPAATAPAAGAQQVVNGCTAERAAIDKQFEDWVSGPNFPADKRDTARAQYRQRMAAVPAQLAQALGQGAAAPAPSATPTPGR